MGYINCYAYIKEHMMTTKNEKLTYKQKIVCGVIALVIGIPMTGLISNIIWYMFCALHLNDSTSKWYIENIQPLIFYGFFVTSALLCIGGVYYFVYLKFTRELMCEREQS